MCLRSSGHSVMLCDSVPYTEITESRSTDHFTQTVAFPPTFPSSGLRHFVHRDNLLQQHALWAGLHRPEGLGLERRSSGFITTIIAVLVSGASLEEEELLFLTEIFVTVSSTFKCTTHS